MSPSRLVVAFLVIVAACAPTRLSVTYHSDPEGAILTHLSDGQKFGPTPVTLYYDLREEEWEKCHVRLTGFSVQWVSGAFKSEPSIELNVCAGDNWTYTYKRPLDAPYLEVDLRHAVDLANLRLQQAQLRRLENVEMLQFLGLINQQNQQLQLNQIRQDQEYLRQQQQQLQQQPYPYYPR